MIDEITDFLFGLKMTIISGIFLLIAIIFMIFGVETPIYLNPAWGTVIISGIPMLLLAMTRLIREKMDFICIINCNCYGCIIINW